MELRLGNQQRHSITAVLLSAVVVVFGLVLVDVFSSPEPDPLGMRTETGETVSTSTDVGVSEPGDDLTAGVARSNARFTLNPEVTVAEDVSTSTAARRSTTAAVETTARPTTTALTTTTTTVTEPPDTSGPTSTITSTSTSTSVSTTSSTSTTAVEPPDETSTTVDDDETTTTRKCRGNRPGCRDTRP